MRRGDLVVIAFQGDYGKPRPALVVQNDAYAEYLSTTVLPLTGDLKDAAVFRIGIEPSSENGLIVPSQIMVDKLATYPRAKVGKVIGRVDAETLRLVERALAAWLGLDQDKRAEAVSPL